MTRNEKISKLAHAVWDYRGHTDQATGKWKKRPERKAIVRVEKWLTELGLPLAGSVTLINSFDTGDKFRAWLQTL